MKEQILIIGGADTFDTYEAYIQSLKSSVLTLERITKKDWKARLAETVPEADVIFPQMPNKQNARYLEWKIWFEKIVPLLRENVVLIGHSMGGIFLVKYLSQNNFPKKIDSLHLVAAPFDTEGTNDSLGDFALAGSLENLNRQAPIVFIYQSTDDVVVPPLNAEKYKAVIPQASVRMFSDRGHFNQEQFSEIVVDIRSVLAS